MEKNMYTQNDVLDYVNEEDVKFVRLAFFDMKVSNFVTQADNGIIHGEANPFNGVLFSKKLIEDIGYPKKEMFIWGDEKNYMLRATKSGKELIIATNAIHVHPRNRQKTKVE